MLVWALAGGYSVKFSDAEVADFLSGENTVRDGRLVGLTLARGDNEWDVVLNLVFEVPRGANGDKYDLTLWGDLSFAYEFSSETMLSEIAFMKCLWTDEGTFYLSLDPWKETERFPSEKDGSCFRSKSASLTVGGNVR
ncbi:hypothetical protein D3C85_1253610 [compost metagenome]